MDSRILANILSIISVVIFTVNPVSAIMYIPAIPDKNKTLPTNDGEPDGCNSSRFMCVMGGEAVLDKQTGFTWLRDADIAEKKMSWTDAVNFCQNIEIGTHRGWRLPTKREMITLLDTSQSAPALPVGHPFLHVGTIGSTYWTNTEDRGDKEIVWIVKMNLGIVEQYLKTFGSFIWPVLGSNEEFDPRAGSKVTLSQ